MGLLKEKDLFKLLAPPEVGSRQKIGAAKAAMSPTATAIRKKNDGFWYYTDEETELTVWPNRFLEFPWSEGKRLFWVGLEVKTRNMAWKGKDLVFALEPYSLNWYGSGRLRAAAKDQKSVAKALAKRTGGDDTKLHESLGELPYDPFETDRKWLTARLDAPTRMHWDDLTPVDRQFAVGRSLNYTAGKEPQWFFAVCEDLWAAEEGVKREVQLHRYFEEWTRDGPQDSIDSLLGRAVRQALAGRSGGDKDARVVLRAGKILQRAMEAAGKRTGTIQR
jgi:hypothetical protein